ARLAVRPARQPGLDALATLVRAGGAPNAGPTLSDLASASPALRRRRSGPSAGATGAPPDRGVLGQAAGRSRAPSAEASPCRGDQSHQPGHASARRLAGTGTARTPRWATGGLRTRTGMTGWVA